MQRMNAEKMYRVLRCIQQKSGRTCTLPLLRIIKPPPCRCSPISNLHDSAGGFSVWHVCASNVRVYPGGLLLDAKTFRNPVLKMWVKKELLSYRAGITALSCALCAGGGYSSSSASARSMTMSNTASAISSSSTASSISSPSSSTICMMTTSASSSSESSAGINAR